MELKIIIPLALGFIVIFVGLALLLRGLLSSQSNLALKKLQRINEENMRREVELKRKLDEAEKDYQQRVSQANAEAKKLQEEIEAKSIAEKNRIIDMANQEREAILRDAREESENIKISSGSSIKDQALVLAGQVFRKAVDKELAQHIHAYLIKNIFDTIRQYRGRALSQTSGTAEIITPFPLSKEQQETLKRMFSEITQKEVMLTEQSDKGNFPITAGAGLYIKLGHLIIDGTLNNLLQKASKEIKES